MWRAVVGAEALRACVAAMNATDLPDLVGQFAQQSPLYEPALLTTLGCLATINPWLQRRAAPAAAALTLCCAVLAAIGWRWGVGQWLGIESSGFEFLQIAATAVLTTGALLLYFDWRRLRNSPAWAESRLMALQARIRPHFLFNSLNSVLALIRSQPHKAETMLEDMSELFRALLSDVRTLVPLEQELALAKAYIEIEQIRLGDRLRVVWEIDPDTASILVPQLLLQPLLENAVRYGVEPAPEGADIVVHVKKTGPQLQILVKNPLPLIALDTHAGNHIALANIRERLSLHFDAEARLQTRVVDLQHLAEIDIPLSKAAK